MLFETEDLLAKERGHLRWSRCLHVTHARSGAMAGTMAVVGAPPGAEAMAGAEATPAGAETPTRREPTRHSRRWSPLSTTIAPCDVGQKGERWRHESTRVWVRGRAGTRACQRKESVRRRQHAVTGGWVRGTGARTGLIDRVEHGSVVIWQYGWAWHHGKKEEVLGIMYYVGV
jgi:hypothetical protein